MTLLAIDPGRSAKGEASIGWALFHDDGQYHDRGEVSFEELQQQLTVELYGISSQVLVLDFQGWEISEVVIENFVNNEKSRGGQTNGTSECIGAVETYCFITKTPFTRQTPAKLGPAKLHAPEGSWKPLKHLRHEDAAYLHGYEYLVGKGVLKSAGLDATM